ncbi:MAG TPA: HD domain-containing phosphohydrolase [Bryobacteraceae bacterium]|nr:HD domain-containing phosphohydrolase [Bryobacteraceae bacterium]
MPESSNVTHFLMQTPSVETALASNPAVHAGFSAEPMLEGGRAGRLLLVDSQEVNRRLAKGMLRSAGQYEFFEAATGRAALEILERQPVDLVILDMMMPDISGPEFCRRLKSNRKTQLLPILMITSLQGAEHEVLGIDAGADEYLTKPLHPSVLRARVRALLRHKSAIDSLDEAETILFALAQAVEARDSYTAEHCQRLATYGVALGVALGLSRPELVALYRGGYLHDIGKVSIPDSILHGNNRLTDAEWVIMKQHTVRGEEICRPMKSLAPVLPIIRSHHEKWDGSGYPDGLRGEQIPLLARILQIVDIFDALITERTYKRAFSVEEATHVLEEEVTRGWRDPELVSLFVSLLNRNMLESTASLIDTDWPELSSMLRSLQSMHVNIQNAGTVQVMPRPKSIL